MGVFQQSEDGFASLGPCGGPHEGFSGVSGAISPPPRVQKKLQTARPRDNSGLRRTEEILIKEGP